MDAKRRPLKRKLEIALAGLLLDRQQADPAFLPGLTIVCATTGRSPADPEEAEAAPAEPPLPYLSVGCKTLRARPDFPPGCGIKDAQVVFYFETHASDTARALADARIEDVSRVLEDSAAVAAALNEPPDPATPDARRQQDLYLYAVEDLNAGDDHTQATWSDEIIADICCQGFDPDYSAVDPG